MNRNSLLLKFATAGAAAGMAVFFVSRLTADDHRFHFKPGSLVLSRSVYVGTSSTVTVDQTLPPGCVPGSVSLPTLAGGTTTVNVPANSNSGCNAAVADGSYPTVFNNAAADGSFGVSSPIFLDDISTGGRLYDTLAVPNDPPRHQF